MGGEDFVQDNRLFGDTFYDVGECPVCRCFDGEEGAVAFAFVEIDGGVGGVADQAELFVGVAVGEDSEWFGDVMVGVVVVAGHGLDDQGRCLDNFSGETDKGLVLLGTILTENEDGIESGAFLARYALRNDQIKKSANAIKFVRLWSTKTCKPYGSILKSSDTVRRQGRGSSIEGVECRRSRTPHSMMGKT